MSPELHPPPPSSSQSWSKEEVGGVGLGWEGGRSMELGSRGDKAVINKLCAHHSGAVGDWAEFL